MENSNSGHSVTEPYHGPVGDLEPGRTEREANQTQRLANVTAAYRHALAEEESQGSEHLPTIQLGESGILPQAAENDLFDDEEAEELILQADSPPTEQTSGNLASKAGRIDGASSEPEEELADDVDDLNNYMESFLQRMKCNPSSSPSERPQPVEQAPEPEPTPAPSQAKQYEGPKAAPECKNDLAVMRELANATAQESLSNHASRSNKQMGRFLLLAVACCLISGVLAFISTEVFSYSYIGAVAMIGLAGFMAWRFWAGINKLQTANQKSPKPSGTQSTSQAEQASPKA